MSTIPIVVVSLQFYLISALAFFNCPLSLWVLDEIARDAYVLERDKWADFIVTVWLHPSVVICLGRSTIFIKLLLLGLLWLPIYRRITHLFDVLSATRNITALSISLATRVSRRHLKDTISNDHIHEPARLFMMFSSDFLDDLQGIVSLTTFRYFLTFPLVELTVEPRVIRCLVVHSSTMKLPVFD